MNKNLLPLPQPCEGTTGQDRTCIDWEQRRLEVEEVGIAERTLLCLDHELVLIFESAAQGCRAQLITGLVIASEVTRVLTEIMGGGCGLGGVDPQFAT